MNITTSNAYESIFLVSSPLLRSYNSREMNKPLWLAIPFRVPQGRVLEKCFLLAYEPVPGESSVVPSGVLTDSEGNPEEILATLGFLDGTDFPRKTKYK